MTRAQFATEFAVKTVEAVEEELEFSKEEIGSAVGADRKTVQRWANGATTPSSEHRRYLELLNQLRFLLKESFRNADARQRWLHSPAPAFGGRTPHFAVTSGELQIVVNALATLSSGAFR